MQQRTVPLAQAMHDSLDELPGAGLYSPTSHGVGSPIISMGQTCPLSHMVQPGAQLGGSIVAFELNGRYEPAGARSWQPTKAKPRSLLVAL